ncbi:PREDICTED: uncharacterized protein LOC107347505 [Acropora digitifera]|uniref:uncharacterized protein LOC107339849 n=1 Tax=Acropora digitifera TaxID=70779 RepID=UPI00077A20DD|nr:PREDICTED: uncharacterized protein LOC107339849 [Acropora digitifera]XP_015768944.1 PREDICTED: uncharacterized protein LOC107347505 [Acropora digitifera]
MEKSTSQLDAVADQFSGLSVSSGYETLYRIVRPDENPEEGLVAKDPSAEKTVGSHVKFGARAWYKSQFISTTKSLEVAKHYKTRDEKRGFTGLRIVKIDLDALPNKCNLQIVDLTIAENREEHLGKAVCKNFANFSQEVLLTCDVPIPCYVITS